MANNADPIKLLLKGAVWSGSTLFAHGCLSDYLENNNKQADWNRLMNVKAYVTR